MTHFWKRKGKHFSRLELAEGGINESEERSEETFLKTYGETKIKENCES